jgi:ADP-ribose pyrophosphatase
MSKDITRYRGRYLSLLERDGWEFASRSNASGVVVIVAVTDGGELVLVEQYRLPVQARVLELPAGLVGDLEDRDETELEAAGRELIEETGYAAGQLEILMASPSSAGMSDEIITFVLATDLQRVGPGGGDASEDIEVLAVSLEQVDVWLEEQRAAGKPMDPKIFAALYWLRNSGQHNASRSIPVRP